MHAATSFAPGSSPRRPPTDTANIARRWLASVASLGAAAAFTGLVLDEDLVSLWLPVGVLIAATYLFHVRHVGAQLLARGVWWSYAVLGALVAVAGSTPERCFGATVGVLAGAALLLGGAVRRARQPGGFRPVSFDAPLTVGLVLAVADALSLTFWWALALEANLPSVPVLACALAMIAAVVGLYRLRVWGVVLNVVANVVIAVLAVSDKLGLPEEICFALVVTAVLQLLLLVPVVVALCRGTRRQAASSAGRRAWLVRAAVALAVVVVMGLALLGGAGVVSSH